MLAERPQRSTPRGDPMRGRVAVVTGGATGIGRVIGLEFARRKVHVAFNYLDLPDRDIAAQAVLTETALRAARVKVYGAPCDVRDRRAVDDFIATARQKLGGIHYLVNNAGVADDGALWRLSGEAWQRVLDTNIGGAFNCTHAVTPIFRQQEFGKIVNMGSYQALQPGFGVANYAASKAALIGLTRASAVDLGRSNVNVNLVAPGFVKTEMVSTLPKEMLERAEQRALLGRVAEPEDIARVVIFLCSDDARHVTGQVLVVDGGFTLGG